MGNLYHSAEGTHWTKKNHKYIRKEGNRYIYPSDLKKMGGKKLTAQQIANRKAAANGAKELYRMNDGSYIREHGRSDQEFAKDDARYKNNQRRAAREQATEVRELARMEKAENRQKAVSRQASPNYKQLSQQHANREAAKNGKIVNPTYTLRDEKGNKVARLKSNDKVMATPGQEYAKWQASQKKQAINEEKRRKALNNQGSTRNYTPKSGHQLNSTDAKRWGLQEKPLTNARLRNKKRRDALNNQGSGKGSQQYAKEQDNWNQIEPGTTRAKRKLATYRQGNSRFADDNKYTKKHVTKEMAQRTDDFDKSTGARKYSESATEKNKEVLSSKSAKKLKDKGYFTVKNGETVFVPSDEITMKKVSKGRQLINKIKSKFSKKKNSK